MKTVCIIGLGPGGMTAVKELKATGMFEVTAYDGAAKFGGKWNGELTGGVWKELIMNSDRRTGEFSDFPWNKEDYEDDPTVLPDYMGMYPNQSEFTAYLKAYAKHFDLEKCFRLQTAVKQTEQRPDGGWDVTVEKAGKTETLSYDYLISATGRNHKPLSSFVDTLSKDFSGQVLHSSLIKSIKDYKNKRVLVIGSSVSGSEVTSELAALGECAKVVNSVRKVPYYITRIVPHKKVNLNDLFFQRFTVWLGDILPDSIGVKGFQSAVLDACPDQVTAELSGNPDLVPDPDIRKSGGIGYTSRYVQSLQKGKFEMKPVIDKVKGKTVTFIDGTSQDFDVIICGTGYEIQMPYLPTTVREKIEYKNPNNGFMEVQLYKHTLPLGVENLAFVGTANVTGPLFATMEMQARYIAAVWSSAIPKPSDKVLKAGIEKFKRHRSCGKHNNADLSPVVCDDIGSELGLTPGIFEALRNPSQLLLAPIYVCYYRTKDADSELAAAAKKRFEYFVANPQTVTDEQLLSM